MTEERLEKLRECGYKVRGIKRSIESKKKYRRSKLGKKNPNYGKSGCWDHINKSQHECEYCGFITTPGNYKRWHGNNCKKAR